jgi:hypothetical protein
MSDYKLPTPLPSIRVGALDEVDALWPTRCINSAALTDPHQFSKAIENLEFR